MRNRCLTPFSLDQFLEKWGQSTFPERRAGFLLRLLQQGQVLAMPISRPMAVIDERCHVSRIKGGSMVWSIAYRLDPVAVIILDVFRKQTRTTPKRIIAACRRRLRNCDNES